MAAAQLRFAYRPDKELNGQLDAAVTSGLFSAAGSVWISSEQLKDTFIAALRSFPLSTSDPPLIEGGFWSQEKPGTLEQCHLRIAIRPYNVLGILLVQVDVASESMTTPDNDLQQSATARFLVEYNALDEFASHLEQVLDGKREAAVLSGPVKPFNNMLGRF